MERKTKRKEKEEVGFLTDSILNRKDDIHKTSVGIKDSKIFKVPRWVTFMVEPFGNVTIIWTMEVIVVIKEMEVSMVQVLEGNLVLENRCKENTEWDILEGGWEEIESETTIVTCGLENSELINELLELRNANMSCWHCSREIGN